MKKTGQVLKAVYCVAMMALLLASLSAATYAWFSTNAIVQTDRVSGKTGTEMVTLLVSSIGGNDFRGASSADIAHVNTTSSESLMPVSTSDLQHFVYNNGNIDEMAVNFVRVQNEQYYYHGRVFLKASAQGMPENAKLKLYLDNAGGLFANMAGYMANAARLGLTFDGGSAKILRISENANPENGRRVNTVVNGTILQADQVISSAGDSLQIVQDPSVSYLNYTIGEDGQPQGNVSPIFVMELNRIYAVDIYFYMEGCDPDCTDITQLDHLDLRLAFYGILDKGGDE